MEFIVRFERALAHQSHKDLTADHIDHNEVPGMQLSTPLERQFREIYMREMLQKFQREQDRSVSCFLERINLVDTIWVYNVRKRVTPGVSKVKEHHAVANYLNVMESHADTYSPYYGRSSRVLKQSILFMLLGQLIDDALLSEEGSKLLQQTFEDLKPKLKSLEKASNCIPSTVEDVRNSSNQVKLKDPQQVRSKGKLKEGKKNIVDRLR
ncbi:unnamed protein product [Prunus armeniaca]